jgi:hypothetical protein
MVLKEVEGVTKFKAETRNKIDIALLAICFTAFSFLASNSPEILSKNIFLTFQLIFAIPLFMNNLFCRIKQVYKDPGQKWDEIGFFSFTIAFGFFINFVGLLLSLFVPINIVLMFFLLNIILSTMRSSVQAFYEPQKLKGKMFREILHLVLIVFLGVLPALKIY